LGIKPTECQRYQRRGRFMKQTSNARSADAA
jgi:hypothetical protein